MLPQCYKSISLFPTHTSAHNQYFFGGLLWSSRHFRRSDCSFLLKMPFEWREYDDLCSFHTVNFSFIFGITIYIYFQRDGYQNIFEILSTLSRLFSLYALWRFGHLFSKYFHISMKLNRIGSRLEFIQSKWSSHTHMCVCANAFEQIFRYNLLASTAKFRNANNEHFSKISKIYCHLFAIKGKETATKKLILDKLNCILLRHSQHLWHFIFIFHVAKVLKWKLSYHFHWMRYYSLAKDQN